MKVRIKLVTRGSFKEFGQVIEIPVTAEPTIAVENVNFWKQQATFAVDGELEVGVLNVKKMEMVFDELENHFNTQTGLICLSGDWAIGVSKPRDEVPKAEDVKAFRIPKGQLVVLEEKCWHTAPYPVDHEKSTMLVICKRNFLDGDTVFEKIDQQGTLVL